MCTYGINIHSPDAASLGIDVGSAAWNVEERRYQNKMADLVLDGFHIPCFLLGPVEPREQRVEFPCLLVCGIGEGEFAADSDPVARHGAL